MFCPIFFWWCVLRRSLLGCFCLVVSRSLSLIWRRTTGGATSRARLVTAATAVEGRPSPGRNFEESGAGGQARSAGWCSRRSLVALHQEHQVGKEGGGGAPPRSQLGAGQAHGPVPAVGPWACTPPPPRHGSRRQSMQPAGAIISQCQWHGQLMAKASDS